MGISTQELIQRMQELQNPNKVESSKKVILPSLPERIEYYHEAITEVLVTDLMVLYKMQESMPQEIGKVGIRSLHDGNNFIFGYWSKNSENELLFVPFVEDSEESHHIQQILARGSVQKSIAERVAKAMQKSGENTAPKKPSSEKVIQPKLF